jgi:nucleoid-associated protein YgaU
VTRDSSRRLIWGSLALIAASGIVIVAAMWQGGRTPTVAPGLTHKLDVPAAKSPATVSSLPQRPAGASSEGSSAAVKAPPLAHTDLPRFDIVRVDPEGHAVLAGRAPPRSEVTVYDGDHELGRVTADDGGDWVLVPDFPLPPGRSQLTLRATTKNGVVIRSDGVVAMLVPERATKPASDSEVQKKSDTTAATPNAEAPIAVLLPKEGPAAGLQLPPLTGTGEERLAMDIIEYGTQGDVIFEGRAAPGVQIGAYLDNRKVGGATADAEGKWRIVTTENVPPGRYRLRLESHNEAGKRVAQLTMPFARAAVPEQIAGDLVVVQPGNSLWRIARRSYGHGRRYLEIYHANHKQISNPKLIFPGQLLQVPSRS